MAKIKKSRSGGEVVYPATIYQAVKDPNSGQRLDEKLAELDEATELVVSAEDEGDVNDPEADIVNEALRKTPQTLTKAEQAQARTNIGAASLEENAAFKEEITESNEAFMTETNEKLSEIGSKAVWNIKGVYSSAAQAVSVGGLGEGDTFIKMIGSVSMDFVSKLNADLSSTDVAITPDTIFKHEDKILEVNDEKTNLVILNADKPIHLSSIESKPSASGTYGFYEGVVYYRFPESVSFSNVTSARLATIKINDGDVLLYDGKFYKKSDKGLVLANVEENVDKLNQEMQIVKGTLSPISDAVNKLGWDKKYKFNGVDSVANLIEPIALSSNGDSIELLLSDIIEGNISDYGYGFSYAGSSSMWRGIGVVSDTLSVRADDGTWIIQGYKFEPSFKTRIKVSYESEKLYIYVNGEAVMGYDSQLPLTIKRFGQGLSHQKWKGCIEEIAVNGSMYDLSSSAILENVDIISTTSFLSEEEKAMLNSNSDNMYVEKKESELDVYIKHASGKFVKYPLNYRYSAYKEGSYPSFFDNWGIGKVALCSFTEHNMIEEAKLFYSSEAELTLETIEGTVGGAMHGFDNIVNGDNGREVSILIDNKKIEEKDTLSLRSSIRIEVKQRSKITSAYSNTNVLGYVEKTWLWENGKLRINGRFIAEKEFELDHIYSSLLGVLRRWEGSEDNQYLTNKAIKNNEPFKVYNIEDGWVNWDLASADKSCSRITVYGDMGIGIAMDVVDSSPSETRGMFISTNNNPYNKIYNRLCGVYTIKKGEELYAVTEWSIL